MKLDHMSKLSLLASSLTGKSPHACLPTTKMTLPLPNSFPAWCTQKEHPSPQKTKKLLSISSNHGSQTSTNNFFFKKKLYQGVTTSQDPYHRTNPHRFLKQGEFTTSGELYQTPSNPFQKRSSFHRLRPLV